MCLTPKTPTYTKTVQTETVKTPTVADASVQKTSENARRQIAGISNESIKTSALGLESDPSLKKKKLGE